MRGSPSAGPRLGASFVGGSFALTLAGIVAVGAALRLPGLDWGLPWAFHIDERLFVVAKAIQLESSLQEGMPDPGITSYGILPLWLLVLARKLFLAVTTAGVSAVHGDDFAGTVYLARALSAAWSVATVLLVGLWAKRWSRGTGLLAAALVAGFPALVQTAHFGTVEATLIAVMVGGMLAAERIAERPTRPALLVGGVLVGLAVSVKAPGAILILPIVHAVRASAGKRFVPRVLVVLGVAAAVALVLNPALFVAPAGETHAGEHTTLGGNLRRAYSSDFHDWTLPYANVVPVWTELTQLLPYGIGVLPELLALLGLAIVVRRRSDRDLRLLLVVAPLLLLLLPARVKTIRFLVPALPAFAVLAAEAVRVVGAWRTRDTDPSAPWPTPVRVAALILALVTLTHGAAYLPVWTGTDPRIQAADWLDENVGPRDIVVVEDPPGYGPPVLSPFPERRRPPLRYEILWHDFYVGHERSTNEERQAHLDRVLSRADWLALSEGHRVEFTESPERRPVESAFYAALDDGTLPFVRVAVLRSPPRLGPWELDDSGAEVLFRIFDHPRIEIWRRRKDAS